MSTAKNVGVNLSADRVIFLHSVFVNCVLFPSIFGNIDNLNKTIYQMSLLSD